MSRLMQERRRLVSAFLGCALAAMGPGALAQAKKSPASKEPLVFSINEGATTLITAEELFERYTRLAKSTERTLARPVRLEVYPETARFRAELDRRRFDIVFGKTVNLLAGMIRDKQFQAVVKTKAPYVAGFITLKGSPIKKPEDMRGKVIMMPERVFTTKLGEATLRDLGARAAREDRSEPEVVHVLVGDHQQPYVLHAVPARCQRLLELCCTAGEHGKVRVEPLRQGNELPADEASRTPLCDPAQVGHGCGHTRGTRVEQRSDTVFLERPVIARRNGASARLCERVRRSDERANDLPHAAEVQPLQVRLHGRSPREGCRHMERVDPDARGVRADELQHRVSA